MKFKELEPCANCGEPMELGQALVKAAANDLEEDIFEERLYCLNCTNGN